MTGRWGRLALALAGLLVLVLGTVLVVLRPWEAGQAADAPPGDPDSRPVTVLAVGDIGRCNSEGDEATARLVAAVPEGTLLALGDIAYDEGSARDYAECYDPSWGRFVDRTRPALGNHEYGTKGATPYFDYFGDRAGERGKGWYSFDLGAWHIVALNSNCDEVGCDQGSEQFRWLRQDLEASDARCTLAFDHHPRFSSGERHGGTGEIRALWRLLLDHDVEALVSGHEHLYERTAPLDRRGDVDQAGGVRQFVVGTGGGNFYPVGDRIPGSEAAITDVNGLLQMTLRDGSYDWEFVSTSADGPSDAGSADCR